MATGMVVDKMILKAAASLGYSDLKPEQKCILKAFVEGKGIFVALPTGFGKSLCYALLPLIFNMKRRAWSLGLYLDCCHMLMRAQQQTGGFLQKLLLPLFLLSYLPYFLD